MLKKFDQKLNSQYVDHFYEFIGKWDAPSRCGLKILKKTDYDVVIATELYLENPGTSATQYCKELAAMIIKDHNLNPERLRFIVRSPENKSKLSFLNEFFSLAILEWDGESFKSVSWESISKEEVDSMIS